MMKQLFHKTLAILMALVVISTTMSFTVDVHYCGESLVDFSFFRKAKTCGMEKQVDSKPCGDSMSKKSCCSEKQVIVKGQEDLKISFENLIFEQQTFVAAFFYSYIHFFESFDKNIVLFQEYSPPFVKRDAQIFYQTYLI